MGNIIVSWNFKHMVNVDTINGVRRITFAKRYNNIDNEPRWQGGILY